jgi:hypothetical protein
MRVSTLCGKIKNKPLKIYSYLNTKIYPEMEVEKCKYGFSGMFPHC